VDSLLIHQPRGHARSAGLDCGLAGRPRTQPARRPLRRRHPPL